MDIKASVTGLDFWYGSKHALKSIDLELSQNKITALIGPSGCGKTTLLRCFNRMHDLYRDARSTGSIFLYPHNIDILSQKVDPIAVRKMISMVFQKPNPFPRSIFENVAYGLRIRGLNNKSEIADRVETALTDSGLWGEVKDRLSEQATMLSGGQQQRLCIARAIAVEPEIVLFDEPTSALDPIATGAIEELMTKLRSQVTILVVTHNMQQAARISDHTAFMYLGELVEYGATKTIFNAATKPLTQQYIAGQFG